MSYHIILDGKNDTFIRPFRFESHSDISFNGYIINNNIMESVIFFSKPFKLSTTRLQKRIPIIYYSVYCISSYIT